MSISPCPSLNALTISIFSIFPTQYTCAESGVWGRADHDALQPRYQRPSVPTIVLLHTLGIHLNRLWYRRCDFGLNLPLADILHIWSLTDSVWLYATFGDHRAPLPRSRGFAVIYLGDCIFGRRPKRRCESRSHRVATCKRRTTRLGSLFG